MKLIDKDALVAEIETIIVDETESIKSFEHSKNVSEVQRSNARISLLEHMRSFLDTIEVKEEVDLKKEIKEVQRNYKTIEDYEGYPCAMYADGIEWIAKHFFELGLKAQKGEEV